MNKNFKKRVFQTLCMLVFTLIIGSNNIVNASTSSDSISCFDSSQSFYCTIGITSDYNDIGNENPRSCWLKITSVDPEVRIVNIHVRGVYSGDYYLDYNGTRYVQPRTEVNRDFTNLNVGSTYSVNYNAVDSNNKSKYFTTGSNAGALDFIHMDATVTLQRGTRVWTASLIPTNYINHGIVGVPIDPYAGR